MNRNMKYQSEYRDKTQPPAPTNPNKIPITNIVIIIATDFPSSNTIIHHIYLLHVKIKSILDGCFYFNDMYLILINQNNRWTSYYYSSYFYFSNSFTVIDITSFHQFFTQDIRLFSPSYLLFIYTI